MGIGIALCFLVSYSFGFLIGFMANTLFLVCFTFYIRRIDSKNRRTNLVNYRRAEILVNLQLMKQRDSNISAYLVVQNLGIDNVVNVVLKLESHYFRLYEVGG